MLGVKKTQIFICINLGLLTNNRAGILVLQSSFICLVFRLSLPVHRVLGSMEMTSVGKFLRFPDLPCRQSRIENNV